MEKLKEEGNLLFKENKLEEAYKKYNDAIEVDPINAIIGSKLYCNKAAVAIKMKDFDKAIDDSTKAIELDKNYTKAYQRRAQCFMELNKWEDALTDLYKSKELDPDDKEIHATIKKAEKTKKKLASRKDYYKILGLTKSANEQEIKKAYKKQAALNHPDRFTDLKEKEKQDGIFKDIGEAYDVLGDESKRRQYDSGVDPNDMMGGGGFNMDDMGDIFSMFMGSGGGGGRGGRSGGGGGGRNGGGFNFSFGGEDFGNSNGGGNRKGSKKKKRVFWILDF